MSISYKATSNRAERSSYGTMHRKKKKTGAKPVARKQPTVTQEERVGWALTRVRSMRARLAAHPEDQVLRLALASRIAEYERERLTLERITQRLAERRT
jgi:hypothetical protein